jgi:hypothetical protein
MGGKTSWSQAMIQTRSLRWAALKYPDSKTGPVPWLLLKKILTK